MRGGGQLMGATLARLVADLFECRARGSAAFCQQ